MLDRDAAVWQGAGWETTRRRLRRPRGFSEAVASQRPAECLRHDLNVQSEAKPH